jgi:CubicO group peptidase (beta-lactamase class C family)
MLTATALLQLVGEGAASLDDPLTTSVPDFALAAEPAWSSSVLLRHLLTHSSGIVDYTLLEGSSDDALLESFTTGDFERIGYPMAPSGRMFNYSNPNFTFTGLVVEKLRGAAYREVMKDRVFAPLGMDRTFFLASEVLADGDYAHASSVDEMNQPIVIAPDSYDNAWSRPAGFAFSSVRDLARFVLFLERGDRAVLPDDLRAAMMSPQLDTKNWFDLDHYGFGISIYEGAFLGGVDQFRRMRFVTHGGAIPGYAAEIWYVPSLRFGAVTLANTDGAYFPNTLVTALRELTSLPPASPAPEFTPDPASYSKYAGTYLDPYNAGTLIVRAHTSSLSISMPDLDRLRIPYEPELVPISPDNFILGVQGFQVGATFILDENDRGEFFRTRPFVARRTNTASLAPPAKLDAAAFLRAIRAESRRSRLLRPAP